MRNPIKIDLWSDVVCPWCYIGKRNLEKGLALFQADPKAVPVEIEYRSFELSPDTPVEFEGSAQEYLMVHKRIPEATAKQMIDRVTGIAKEAGLSYDYASIQHTSTVRAHQLLHHAKTNGVQGEMKERLLSAYFIEGRHIGREEDLADLASEVGLDHDEALEVLSSERYLADVRSDQTQARDLGINGVPFFVFDMSYGLSGAQPPEVFYRALVHAASQ